jgi:hypothetical protein
MFKQLMERSADTCDAMGGRILPRLKVDPRLTDAAAALQAGQEGLKAKASAYRNAVEAVRSAGAARDQALRDMEDRTREFALNLLSVVRNNHGADTYLRYFPVGYGSALREKPEQIPEITRAILGKLDEETNPWLVSFRDRITATHDAFLAAQSLCIAAIGHRIDAASYLKAEKRLWIQALSVSRLRAWEACLGDEAYVRAIFAPARVSRRTAASGMADGDAVAETTGNVEVPAVPAPLMQSAVSGAGLQLVGAM